MDGQFTANLETAVGIAKSSGDFSSLDGILDQCRKEAPSAETSQPAANDTAPATDSSPSASS